MAAARYCRLPYDVLTDKRLQPSDKVVYALLASTVWQGSTCSVGMREIANQVNLSTRAVYTSIARLTAAGHVQPAKPEPGRRQMYCLASAVFGQKARSGESAIVSGPSGIPREVGAPQAPRRFSGKLKNVKATA